MANEILIDSWQRFARNLSVKEEISVKWLILVKEAYDNRPCYDLPYLQFKLEQFEHCRDLLKNENSVFAAIIFQSYYYDIKTTEFVDNCVAQFMAFAGESGLDKDVVFIQDVCKLIQLSVDSSTPENKEVGAFGELDLHYFLDINFAIFGSDWDEYSKFKDKNRKEYDFLSESAYNGLRLKVLENFMKIPNIFATKYFRTLYEVKARENLQNEIKTIKET